jgi:hypothetical protein
MIVIAEEGIHEVESVLLTLQNLALALVGSSPVGEADIVALRALAHDLTELGLGDPWAEDAP